MNAASAKAVVASAINSGLIKPSGIDAVCSAIGELFHNAVEGSQKAGKALVQFMDANPSANPYQEIIDRMPYVTPRLIGRLEKIGRGQLDARIAFSDCEAAAWIESHYATIPIEVQRQALDKPIAVAVGGTVENPLVEMLPLSKIKTHQCSRIFKRDGFAKPAEQIQPVSALPPAERYVVKKDGVQFLGSPFFKFDDLYKLADGLREKRKQDGLKSLESDIKKRQVS